MAAKHCGRRQTLLKSCSGASRGGLAPNVPRTSNVRRPVLPHIQRNCAVSASADADDAPLVTLDSIVPALGYAAMIGYVVKFSPNQTPLRDQCATTRPCSPTPLHVPSPCSMLDHLPCKNKFMDNPNAEFIPSCLCLCRYFIEKLVGLGVNDGVPLNPILVSVFLLMGIYPVILASLGTPSLRSANKVPFRTSTPPVLVCFL